MQKRLDREAVSVAITEGMRYQLHQGLEEALGPENAATMMSYLPPVGWADVATKRDLEVIVAKIESLGNQLRAEFHAGLRSNLLGMVAANAATAGMIIAALKLG